MSSENPTPDIRPKGKGVFLVSTPHNPGYFRIRRRDLRRLVGKYSSIIRLHTDDYQPLAFTWKKGKPITHFNLQRSGHTEGHKYKMMQILGRTPENEPVLDVTSSVLVKCIGAREFVPYRDITEEDFKNALPGTKTIGELQETILWRYASLFPDKTREELLALGVGITHLVRLDSAVWDDMGDIADKFGY